MAEKLERYKSDKGNYPTSAELKADFSTDSKYALTAKDHSNKYLGLGLTIDNNFFYCKKDESSQYVLLAVYAYDYAVYVTEGVKTHEYNLERLSQQDYPSDYPFHVHVSASDDVCPKFLPGFTDSSMGATIRDGWASWTGVR